MLPTASSSQQWSVPIVSISSQDPVESDLQNGLQIIRDKINTILSKVVIPECGDRLWYRVAYLNMSDLAQQCPPAYNTSGVRACGRPVTNEGSCPATVYSIGFQYSRVCGRTIEYQVVTSDGFRDTNGSIDQSYLDGVSIIYGTPRIHIWSYVAGVTEIGTMGHRVNNCPCSTNPGGGSQSFVGDNYYCESGNNAIDFESVNQIFINDPLWDGQQCEGTCCNGTNSPPWFSVQLPAPTNEKIEVHICANESTDNEDTPIKLLELYVSM